MERFRPAHVVADDTRLANDLRAGREEAVRELYSRFGGLVFSVAHRVVGDRQRAEDVTQHVFLQAWRNADNFEPGRDFAPWLATIARRAAIDAVRYEKRRPTDAIDDVSPGQLTTPPPSATQLEVVWEVRAAIDLLEPDERDIVRMQHLEGYSQSQIADRLGIAVGTVKSRSHRAHRRLASRLEHLRESEAS